MKTQMLVKAGQNACRTCDTNGGERDKVTASKQVVTVVAGDKSCRTCDPMK